MNLLGTGLFLKANVKEHSKEVRKAYMKEISSYYRLGKVPNGRDWEMFEKGSFKKVYGYTPDATTLADNSRQYGLKRKFFEAGRAMRRAFFTAV